MTTATKDAGAPVGAPIPTSSIVTPSGTVIDYHAKPKRYYTANGVEVPSVTKVLEVLDKPALPWWGMTVGIDAIRSLIQMEVLNVGSDGTTRGLFQTGHLLDKSELVELVKHHQLTTNHVLSAAGDRGTGVHDALETWAAIGKMPNPDDFPWEEKGYVTGLLAFLTDAAEGELKPEMFEVMVASTEHGFAGRFDLLAKNEKDMRVVTKVYPKIAPKYTTVPGGSRCLLDLKTSKGIYPNHFIQLEAYEGGLLECGYGTTDARAVLHVTADGRYEFRRARATLDQFLAVLGCYEAMIEVKKAMKL